MELLSGTLHQLLCVTGVFLVGGSFEISMKNAALAAKLVGTQMALNAPKGV